MPSEALCHVAKRRENLEGFDMKARVRTFVEGDRRREVSAVGVRISGLSALVGAKDAVAPARSPLGGIAVVQDPLMPTAAIVWT